MRLGIKGKQVLGVTSIVGAVVVVLSLMHLARLARVSLEESRARAELLANAIFHRAREVVASGADPYDALRDDPVCARSSSRACTPRTSRSPRSSTRRDSPSRTPIRRSKASRCRRAATWTSCWRGRRSRSCARSIPARARTSSSAQPLLLGDTRVRIDPHRRLDAADPRRSRRVARRRRSRPRSSRWRLRSSCAMLLAQLLLRPIHVIRSGLTRLGRGEFGVRLDLDQHDEFGELGTFFNAVSAAAVGRSIADGRTGGEPRVGGRASRGRRRDRQRRAASCCSRTRRCGRCCRRPRPARRSTTLVAADHPLRRLSEQTLVSRQSRGPLSATFADRRRAASG